PNASAARSRSSWWVLRSARSAATARWRSGCSTPATTAVVASSSRSTAQTRAPAAANCSTIALPIPPAAPVTTTLRLSRPMLQLLADLLERGRLATAEAEAQRDHAPLALGELRDRPAHGVRAHGLVDLVLGGRAGRGEQVAEARVAVRADRGVRRGDRLRGVL